jgi:hypothetical protein
MLKDPMFLLAVGVICLALDIFVKPKLAARGAAAGPPEPLQIDIPELQ